MVRPAQNRIVGTLAATALFALAATEAAAQDGPDVLNEQLQLGDVISGQVLNVEGVRERVTVTNSAVGNSLAGSTDGVAAYVVSRQDMQGNARATTELGLSGDTGGYVHSTTQAGGNYLAATATNTRLDIDATQTTGTGEIIANTFIRGGEARLLQGGSVGAVATANTTLLGGTGASINGSVTQDSAATVRAGNLAETRYVPATAVFSSQAVANTVSAHTPSASNQVLVTRQRSTGDLVEADTSANAANGWDLTSQSHAAANQAAFYNGGGSVVLSTEQENQSQVRSRAVTTSYDFGAAYAQASGAGNQVEVTNNDVYLEIDNNQLNSGGVDVEASFTGNGSGAGYDAYVNATAVGNSVSAYACSTCAAQIAGTNNQVNTGNVSAIANTTIVSSGRSVLTGSSATGNAATFHITRPGQ